MYLGGGEAEPFGALGQPTREERLARAVLAAHRLEHAAALGDPVEVVIYHPDEPVQPPRQPAGRRQRGRTTGPRRPGCRSSGAYSGLWFQPPHWTDVSSHLGGPTPGSLPLVRRARPPAGTDGPVHHGPRPGPVVVGSNWGQAHQPAWSANLLADPQATVTLDSEQIPVRATLVTGPDRDRLWEALRAEWPAYRTYERRAAGRELRMFRLERNPALGP